MAPFALLLVRGTCIDARPVRPVESRSAPETTKAMNAGVVSAVDDPIAITVLRLENVTLARNCHNTAAEGRGGEVPTCAYLDR